MEQNPDPGVGRETPAAENLDGLAPETLLIRGGRGENDGALAPLVWATTTFRAESVEEARRMAKDLEATRFYTRYSNPTVRAFEETVALLEGAESARAFASGMGAISGVVFSLCSPGDHIVTQRQLYAGTQLLFHLVAERFGMEVTFVDATRPGAFADAVRPGKTQLVFAETPANPRLDIVDLEEVGSIKGPVRVVDSTFATPLGLRPLEFGVDLVVHSATKGLAGHNDASLGVVAGSKDLVDWIRGFAVLQGANASVYDSWSGLRGLRTLAARFERQCRSAALLAETLERHEQVSSVRYPGLASHPQHELAKRQMRAYGGLLTFDLRGGLEAGKQLVKSLRIAQFATSLGGPETLVSHPASTTHVDLTPQELEAAGIGPGTIRVSVGLEDPEDLVRDFGRALDEVGRRTP